MLSWSAISQWPWWLWMMWIGTIAFVICKLLIIADKIREAAKSKSVTAAPEKKEPDPSRYALPDSLVVVTLRPMWMSEVVRSGLHIADIRDPTGKERNEFYASRHLRNASDAGT